MYITYVRAIVCSIQKVKQKGNGNYNNDYAINEGDDEDKTIYEMNKKKVTQTAPR